MKKSKDHYFNLIFFKFEPTINWRKNRAVKLNILISKFWPPGSKIWHFSTSDSDSSWKTVYIATWECLESQNLATGRQPGRWPFKSWFLNFVLEVKDFKVLDLRFDFSMPKSPRGQILRSFGWNLKRFPKKYAQLEIVVENFPNF